MLRIVTPTSSCSRVRLRNAKSIILCRLRETVAKRLAADPLPDVVLLDLRMPRCDGFETLEVIRATPRLALLPTLIYTSSASPEDRDRAHELGATEFVTKPSGINLIRRQIVDLVAQYSSVLVQC